MRRGRRVYHVPAVVARLVGEVFVGCCWLVRSLWHLAHLVGPVGC